jgi:RNA polymerase sigma-70 factor, ECF subfamily
VDDSVTSKRGSGGLKELASSAVSEPVGVEPQAIEAVYMARQQGFRNALATVTGGFDSARDAVQEGFAIALAKRSQFRGGSLEAWIWRICLSCALDGRRAARRLAPSAVPDTPDVQLPEPTLDPELAAAVRALAARQRLMVFLRYYADLTYAQIAEACGVSEGTVAAALAQARAVLLEALDPEGVHR